MSGGPQAHSLLRERDGPVHIYPAHFCDVIHDGFEAREFAPAGMCTSDGCVATLPDNQNPLIFVSSAVKVFDSEVGIREQLAFSSTAVTVYEPDASIHNPLTLSSAAVTICELTANNPNPSTFSSAAVKVCDLAARKHNPSTLCSAAIKVCDLANAKDPA